MPPYENNKSVSPAKNAKVFHLSKSLHDSHNLCLNVGTWLYIPSDGMRFGVRRCSFPEWLTGAGKKHPPPANITNQAGRRPAP